MVREPAAVLSRPAIALAALGLFDLLAPYGPDLGTWAQVRVNIDVKVPSHHARWLRNTVLPTWIGSHGACTVQG